MKNLFKELKRINKVLEKLDEAETTIKDLPYYDIFGTQSEKQKDLARVKIKRIFYLDEKHTALEAIQLACEKEKFLVSANQRNLKIA